MSDLDWTNGEWVNGPKLAAWLRERDRLPEPSNDRGGELDWLRRRINYWESGEQASLATVDRWLCFLGCHISELPDHFWEPARPRRHRAHSTPEERRRVLAWMDEHGANQKATAEQFGLAAKTVETWVRRSRKAVAA